jgi:hypothetical protein
VGAPCIIWRASESRTQCLWHFFRYGTTFVRRCAPLCAVAGLGNVTDRACALFDDSQLQRLEWLDDVDLMESHAWGSEVNYRMAAPLLQDLRATLQVSECCERSSPAAPLAQNVQTL